MLLSKFSLLLSLIILIGGCSLATEPADKTKDWPAEKLYSSGKKALDTGDYEAAIQYFEILETRYPFGRHAQQAQLDIAYSEFKQSEPDTAISIMDRFIRTYPRHPNIDYAYYLKGLANFSRDNSVVDRFLRKDPSHRDPGSALQSFRDFDTLLTRFPNSRYADDARQRMVYLRNNLAEHEIHVARYYIRRGAFVAAANRAKYVVENYQQTPSVPNALEVMVYAYSELGLEELKSSTLRVLQHNYPNHPLASSDAIKQKRSWWPLKKSAEK